MKQFLSGLLLVFMLFCGLALNAQVLPPIEKSAPVSLVIQAAPDFTLEVTPASITTFPNRTIAYSVTLRAVNNFAGDVELSIEGLPANVTAAWFPSNKITVGGPDPRGAQLNITTAATAAPGTYVLTVKAKSTVYN